MESPRTSNQPCFITQARVVTCPICCESLPCRPHPPIRPCCGQVTCQSCLHSHIQSVFSEGQAGGRTKLSCPLGCGAELTDREVRRILRYSNWSFRHHLLGEFLFRLLLFMGFLFENTYHSAWVLMTMSAGERAELSTYERWSLSVALGPNRSDSDKEAEEIMRCPVPDCGYAWVANAAYRKKKISNERKYDSTRRSSSLMRSASSWLFYRPPKPESVPDDWVDGQYVSPFDIASARTLSQSITQNDETDKTDGRRVICPACRNAYCGLCRRPWVTYRAGRPNKRECHKNRLCNAFARRTSTDGDDYAYAATTADARICPGCSMRTSRTEGCNHMTCPCGFEWCYVCESRWSVRHYGCSDSSRRVDEAGGARGCIIS